MRTLRHQERGNSTVCKLGTPLAALLSALTGVTLLFAPGEREAGTTLILTRVPASETEGLRPRSGGMLPAEYGDGAQIVLAAPGEAPRVLTPGFHAAMDPEISFDGGRLLFAGKRQPSDPWDIYEKDLAGGPARRITRGLGDCRSPVYLGSFYTIDSAEPWDQIAFTSTASGELNEHGGEASTSLYTARLDGSSVNRITFNPSSDMDPAVLPDGRLLFSVWQRSTLAYGPRGRISLFAAQTDGLDYAIFSGDEGLRIKRMPVVTTGRRVVFVEGDGLAWDGAGSLAMVDLRRNLHSYRRLTGEGDGWFLSPSAHPAGGILVSRRPADGSGTHAVHWFDPGTGASRLIYDDPSAHDIQPVALAPRPRPDGRSSIVSEKFDTGKLYGLDVYTSDLGKDWIARGTPVRLRVLEGIPRRRGGQPERVEESPEILQRRFLGEVPVEKDGSFNVEVPVGLPIQLQLVDGDGLALGSCGWISVRNRETRGCIGCHEDGERTPENSFVDALAGPPVALTLPPGRRRTVDFRRDVAPVLEAKCSVAACHGDDGAPPRLQGGPLQAYRGLMRRSPQGREGGASCQWYVQPGSARTSPLVSSLLGREAARPWDRSHGACDVPPMPPGGREPLTAAEKRTLVEWIDLGALWDGIPPTMAPPPAKAAAGDTP